jgi:hypothetical protein
MNTEKTSEKREGRDEGMERPIRKHGLPRAGLCGGGPASVVFLFSSSYRCSSVFIGGFQIP